MGIFKDKDGKALCSEKERIEFVKAFNRLDKVECIEHHVKAFDRDIQEVENIYLTIEASKKWQNIDRPFRRSKLEISFIDSDIWNLKRKGLEAKEIVSFLNRYYKNNVYTINVLGHGLKPRAIDFVEFIPSPIDVHFVYNSFKRIKKKNFQTNIQKLKPEIPKRKPSIMSKYRTKA